MGLETPIGRHILFLCWICKLLWQTQHKFSERSSFLSLRLLKNIKWLAMAKKAGVEDR